MQTLVNRGVISSNEYFTPEVQDRAGLALMQGRGLNSYLNGSMSAETFAKNLSNEWIGLRNAPSGQLIAALEKTKENYNNSKGNLDTTDDERADRTNSSQANTVNANTANTVTANTTYYSAANNYDEDVSVTGPQTTWEEPGPAYAAEYPYNRVIETGSGHSVEIDDTPGAERVVIYHKDGSYIQMGTGANTYKSTRDTFDVNDKNHHVYVGGTNIITIEGDSHVLVKGNKVEEIQGNYRQIIHGSHEVGVAGQMNFNSGDGGQIRAAALSLESNVENFHIKVGKSLKFQSGEDIHIKTNNLYLEGTDSINIKSSISNIRSETMFIDTFGTFNLKSGSVFIDAFNSVDLKSESVHIGGGSETHISSDTVYIDVIVQLASGSAISPEGAADGDDFNVEDAAEVNRPAPPPLNIPKTTIPETNVTTTNNLETLIQ